MKRPCLDCGTPTAKARCPACTRPRLDNSRAWRAQARELYGLPCLWCGAPADTADHLVPLAHGGTNDPANVVPACRSCNSARRDGRRFDGQRWRAS